MSRRHLVHNAIDVQPCRREVYRGEAKQLIGATGIAGIPALISRNVNGLLVPPGPVATLMDGLQPVLDDAGLRDRLGSEARAEMVSSYNFELRMQRIAGVYECAMPTRATDIPAS